MSTAAQTKQSPTKAGSSLPKKKLKTPSGKDVKKKIKAVPQVLVVSFRNEFLFEAYMACTNDSNDCFNGFRKYSNGETPYPRFDDLGFGDVKYRRLPGSRSEIFTNDGRGNFWRVLFIRYLDQPSTAESRAEGLQAVREFIMSTSSSKWPPKEVTVRDITNMADPHPLDAFFLDADVEGFMKAYLEEEQFDGQFYKNCREFAEKCWSGPHDSTFATALGFPSY